MHIVLLIMKFKKQLETGLFPWSLTALLICKTISQYGIQWQYGACRNYRPDPRKIR